MNLHLKRIGLWFFFALQTQIISLEHRICGIYIFSKWIFLSFEQFKQGWTLLQSAARCKLLQNLCLIFPSLCLWSGQFVIVITLQGGNFSSLRPETSGINLIKRQELWYNVGAVGLVTALATAGLWLWLWSRRRLGSDWDEERERRWGTQTGGAGDTATGSGAAREN